MSRDGRLMPPTGNGGSVPDVAVVSASVVCPRVLKGKRFRVPTNRAAAKARLKAALKLRRRKMAIVEHLRRPSKTNCGQINEAEIRSASHEQNGRSAGNQG